jgi:hypothetical protein
VVRSVLKALEKPTELYQLWRRLSEFIRGLKTQSDNPRWVSEIDEWAFDRLSGHFSTVSNASPLDAGAIMQIAVSYPQREFVEM